MKIDNTTPVRNASVRRKPSSGRGGGQSSFAASMTDDTRSASATVTAHEPLAVDPLLALQEAADSTRGNSRARVRADAILDRLEELRLGLLMGFVSQDRMQELARLTRERREVTNDPRLKEILEQIELRAQVELAKLSIEA